ncbi:MAG: prephenate dehydrogenase, partial [Gemmatimonadaceae bacterium]|nr:prephenate dehydrogenase [Gemmatimonadaceae bacterium]
LGTGVELIDAAEHDTQMAWRSHLPHVTSAALATLLADRGVRRSALGPGGRDMTRLAGSAPALWIGIALDNRQPVVDAVVALEERLREFRSALANEDVDALRDFFVTGCEWFDGSPTVAMPESAG